MPSFDVVSRVDMQEMDNAVNQTRKEVATRFDFRDSKTTLELDRKRGVVYVRTETDMRLQAIDELLLAKAIRRGIDGKALTFAKAEHAAGDMLKQEVTITTGLDDKMSRQVVKLIKESRRKVQVATQGDEVRVSGKNKDDLQAVIGLLRTADLGVPLQFVNMRE